MKLSVSLFVDITRHEVVKRAFSCLDGVLSVGSVIVSGALLAFGALWFLQKAPSHEIVYTGTLFVISAGEEIKLDAPVTIRTNSSRAVYHMWLADDSGLTVHVYPDHEVANPSNFTLNQQLVDIPISMKPGVYTLNAEYLYPFNPLKNADISMNLARVEIKE